MSRAPGNESLSEGWIIQPASSGQLARRQVPRHSVTSACNRCAREEDREGQGKTPENFAALGIPDGRCECYLLLNTPIPRRDRCEAGAPEQLDEAHTRRFPCLVCGASLTIKVKSNRFPYSTNSRVRDRVSCARFHKGPASVNGLGTTSDLKVVAGWSQSSSAHTAHRHRQSGRDVGCSSL